MRFPSTSRGYVAARRRQRVALSSTALDDTVISGVSGLRLWVRTSSLTGLAHNASVAQWNDESGNSNHLTQASDSLRPKWKSAPGYLGKSSVLFDGVNDVLTSPLNTLATNTHSVFVVGCPLVSVSNDIIGTGGTVAGDMLLGIYEGALKAHVGRTTAGFLSATSVVPLTHPNAFAIFEQEVTTTHLRTLVNGNVSAVTALSGTAANGSKRLYLGSRLNSFYFYGHVLSVVVYDTVLTTKQKAAIRGYLYSAFSISSTYPDAPIPNTPVDFNASDNGDGSAYLQWSTDIPFYVSEHQIERKESGAPDTNYVLVDTISGGDLEYWDYSAPASQGAYIYRISARSPRGNSPFVESSEVFITGN